MSFLSLPARTPTLKRKGGHAPSLVGFAVPELLLSPAFVFPSAIAFILLSFSLLSHFHALERDLIGVQWLCHISPYLPLKCIYTPSPGAPLIHPKPVKGGQLRMLLTTEFGSGVTLIESNGLRWLR